MNTVVRNFSAHPKSHRPERRMLEREEELALAYAWRDERDEAALHQLVVSYLALAESMAKKFVRYGVPLFDLQQEAALGVMKAAEKFDPDRGVRFSTYAVWWIKASIQDYVMRQRSVVRMGSTVAQKSLFFNLRRVKARLERETSQRGEVLTAHVLRQQIAGAMNVSVRDVEMMEARLASSDYSLNAPRSTDESEGGEWIEILEDEQAAGAESAAVTHDQVYLKTQLQEAVAQLPERERDIIIRRKLSEDPPTLEVLGEEYNLTKERIRQLEHQGLKRLYNSLKGDRALVALLET